MKKLKSNCNFYIAFKAKSISLYEIVLVVVVVKIYCVYFVSNLADDSLTGLYDSERSPPRNGYPMTLSYGLTYEASSLAYLQKLGYVANPSETPSSLPKESSLTETHSSTLTPMHLRKAKLMFFWVRYPSSAVLKMYFPDIKFNKNNTAQLVKWFSNFRLVDFQIRISI